MIFCRGMSHGFTGFTLSRLNKSEAKEMKRFKNLKIRRDGSQSSCKGLFSKALMQYLYRDWREARPPYTKQR
jgi:hypothetical protein